jgi:LuxR family transcriptional regulator of spore coat protein
MQHGEHTMTTFLNGLQLVRITNVIQKLGVKGRAQAVIELIRMGEIKL